jgi:hypothetical protein
MALFPRLADSGTCDYTLTDRTAVDRGRRWLNGARVEECR